MSNRFKVLGGSLAGAFAIHVALVACGSVSPPPAAKGDGGFVDAVSDAIQRLADAVADAEVRDAHAGGDGGAPDAGGCSCVPERPEYTFTASVVRDGMTLRPAEDYSRALLAWSISGGPGRESTVDIGLNLSFSLTDGSRIQVSSCNLTTDLAGTPVARGFRCQTALYRSADQTVDGEPSRSMGDILVDARATTLTDDRAEVSVSPITFNLTRSGAPVGTLELRDLVVRARVPGATNLTPPRAYRP